MSAENVFKQDQYLVFSLAGQDYGVDILRVREIIEYRTLTHVPRSPFAIIGVINLRGEVVAIVDLTLTFGLRPSPVTPRTCIIIVETESDGECNNVGIIVDSVSRVVRFTTTELLAVPAFGAGVCARFLRGIGKAENKFVLLLDIDRAIATQEPTIISAPEASQAEAQPSRESTAK
jgi:purine-binding chemotaxis protein CheW